MHDVLINLDKFLSEPSVWGLLASFMGGVFVSVSPCVLPLIPLTFGIISEVALRTKIRPAILSVVFVAGITLTYVAFGLVAAVFGIFLEGVLSPRLLYIVAGAIFVVLGISFFDIFNLSFLNFTYNPRLTVTSVFVIGVVSGFTMLPCTFPILGTILGLISLRRNILFALLSLIFFAAGYATVFIIIGDSTVLIKKFTARGKWLIIMKRILGIVVLLVGVYFIVSAVR